MKSLCYQRQCDHNELKKMNSLHYQTQCDHKNPDENNSKFILGFFEVYSVQILK